MSRLARLEQEAISFIRNAESLALRMDERGFHVAFSGGKDSQVMLALVEMAGVKYHAEMQVTSVDPPNLMRFVRTHYPQVKLNLPELNMRQLIIKKGMLPTRIARFCCKEFKEQAGAGCVTCIGIRAAESVKRSKRHAIEVQGTYTGFEIVDGKLQEATPGGEQLFDMDADTKVYCVKGKDKVTIAPIFKWTDNDVWNFIREHKMPYCDLYDKGFHRIGCMLCPMSQPETKRREMAMFPLVAERVYIKAIRELMAKGKYDRFDTPEQVFEWWISCESVDDWFAKQDSKNQPNLFDYDNTEI